jgi:pyridoxamine 5'-phosphate oxidase-like protein
VLAGDLTAGLAYLTPAGGAVVTAVAPVGLRDREAGVVTFTTSFGFAKKLDRIRRDPHVALAFHAREHGFSRSPRYVLVQGMAAVREPDEAFLRDVVSPQSARYLGPPRQGRFWDRWMREYYADRVGVDVRVERILTWPDLACAGGAETIGSPLPDAPVEPQSPPRNGIGPRIDVARAARRLARLPHRLLAFRGGDGHPVAVPFDLGEPGADGLRIRAGGDLVPPGGRRAGLLAHDYRAQLVGLSTRQHTGWLEAGADGEALYAPHTDAGFRAPANKTLLLLANGFLAKRNVRRGKG